MNIGIDIAGILAPPVKNRGITYYNLDCLKKLFQQDQNNQYFVINFFENTDLDKLLGKYDNVFYFQFDTGLNHTIFYNYDNIRDNIISNFINEHCLDVFWLTYTFNTMACYNHAAFQNVKVVVTVYDIIPGLFKNEYLADPVIFEWYMNCIDFLKHCDYLFAISESVRSDLIHELSLDKNKIACIHAGIRDIYSKIDVSVEQRQLLLYRYGIKSQFIIYTGGLDYRKNIDGLIQAYAKLSKNLREQYSLVIVCNLPQDQLQRFNQLTQQHNVQNNVVFTGFIPDEDLLFLYNMAYFLVFPSKYEGLGLPILEAMACGLPVVASNNSGVGEICGDAAILFDPFRVDSIQYGLEKALTTSKRENYIRKGYERCALYTWERTANHIIKTLSKISEYSLDPIPNKIAVFISHRMTESIHIDYITSALTYLQQHATIDVFVDSDLEEDMSDHLSYSKYCHTDFKNKRNQYIDTIYFICNETSCSFMIPYLCEYGGIVDLFDLQINQLLLDPIFTNPNKYYFDFEDLLHRHHYHYTVDLFLENSELIIVHNINYKKLLLNNYESYLIYYLSDIQFESFYTNISRININKPISAKTIQSLCDNLIENGTISNKQLFDISRSIGYANQILLPHNYEAISHL